MPVPNIFRWFLVGLCLGIIFSCVKQTQIPLPVQNTPDDTPVITPGPATIMPIPEITKSPLMVSSTNTPFSTITKKPYSSYKEWEENVLRLLNTNGGCKLPCFWGISPGKTSWQSGVEFLRGIDLFGLKGVTKDGRFPFYSIGISVKNHLLSMVVTIYKVNDMVGAIVVEMDGFQKAEITKRDWGVYSLKRTLTQLGTPSRILIGLETPHEPPIEAAAIYNLWTIYDEFGVNVYYLGSKIEGSNSFEICPEKEKEIQMLALFLRIPGSNIAPPGWNEAIGGDSIEEVSSLTRNQFYNLFTQEGNSMCFFIKP